MAGFLMAVPRIIRLGRPAPRYALAPHPEDLVRVRHKEDLEKKRDPGGARAPNDQGRAPARQGRQAKAARTTVTAKRGSDRGKPGKDKQRKRKQGQQQQQQQRQRGNEHEIWAATRTKNNKSGVETKRVKKATEGRGGYLMRSRDSSAPATVA